MVKRFAFIGMAIIGIIYTIAGLLLIVIEVMKITG